MQVAHWLTFPDDVSDCSPSLLATAHVSRTYVFPFAISLRNLHSPLMPFRSIEDVLRVCSSNMVSPQHCACALGIHVDLNNRDAVNAAVADVMAFGK